MADANPVNEAVLRIQQLARLGLVEAAAAACRELLQRAPQSPDAWLQWGLLALACGSQVEAETALRRAITLNPGHAAAWNQLSVALNRQQKGGEAEAAARQALTLDVTNASHWLNLGNALFTQRRWAEASEALRRSLARNPQDAAAWNNLGAAELKQDRLTEAEAAYQRSLELAPGHLGPLINYTYLLCQRGQRQQARDMLRGFLARESLGADGYAVVGHVCQLLGDFEQAVDACRRALALAPRHRLARHNLVLALSGQWSLSEAEAVARQFVTEEPQHADAWSLLGGVLEMEAHVDEAVAALRRAVELEPDPDRHSRLLFSMHNADDVSAEQLLAAHRQWDAAYAHHLLPSQPPVITARDPARPLRLGFLSADFWQHPVGFMVLPELECLDKTRCSVVCYPDRLAEDEFTARFRATADLWRPTGALSVEQLAEQIRDDKIDILVDLMGHTANRLLAFARKPAPLQVTWFGYVGTTGLAAMDFILADRFHVREGEEIWYTETVLRMPHGYACYGAPAYAPEVGPLPAQAAGYVTFGCFNRPHKYTPTILDAWAAILRRVPTARLLLKYGGLDQPAIQEWICGQLQERGVEEQRILLEGIAPHRELLASYNRVDLALDTRPYSGGLTTCEALWMGVPVITCPGQTFASRHSVSHLSNAGYEQFVAADMSSYVELAIKWANRPDELALVRSQMREQVRQSPLCDAPRFASDLLCVLQQAWDSRAAGRIPAARRAESHG